MSDLSHNIKKLMKAQGISVYELAHESGIPQPTLHKIVNGISKKPNSKSIKKIAEYFNVDISTLTLSDEERKEIDFSLEKQKITDIYIGVYGTSSKTNIKIESADSRVIGYAEVEEANLFLSVKHTWDAIIRGIKQALSNTEINLNDTKYHFHLGLGLKYTELAETCAAFEKAKPAFIHHLKLVSDGYVLCLGAHKIIGGIIIVDQGVVGNVVTQEGELIKIGGWGFPHSDQGSFPWIGMEAVRLTLQWIDGHIEVSPLLKAIYNHFDNNTYKLVQWAMQSRAYPDEYIIICEIVLNHIRTNDVYAIQLLQKTAEEATKIYQKLIELSHIPHLPICLFGYLAPYAEKYLEKNMIRNITYPNTNAVHGAIRMIKEYVNANQP